MKTAELHSGPSDGRRTVRRRQPVTPSGFSTLYHDEFVPMVRLAVLLTGNQEVAADVVQDAFVRLHLKWASVNNPVAYLRTSVVNGVRSYHRRRLRRREVSLTDQTDGREQAVRHHFDDAFDHTLATLQVLSPRERACVVLKFYLGLPEREIASTVRCRPGSVGPTLQRAMHKLKSHQ